MDGIRRLQESSTTVGIVAVVSSLWVGASFWGALDTAFCRIYHRPCRSWVHQKLFGFAMLFVVLDLHRGERRGADRCRRCWRRAPRICPFRPRQAPATSSTSASVGLGLTRALRGAVHHLHGGAEGLHPWSCVWPGAFAATLATGIVNVAFPVYLTNISTLRIGTSAVFVLIALVWFYVLALDRALRAR